MMTSKPAALSFVAGAAIAKITEMDARNGQD
jgi:hypothetical protein